MGDIATTSVAVGELAVGAFYLVIRVGRAIERMADLEHLDLSGNKLTDGMFGAMPEVEGAEGMTKEDLEAAMPEVNFTGNPWEGDFATELGDFQGNLVAIGIDETKGKIKDHLELDDKILEAIDGKGLLAKSGTKSGAKLLLKIAPVIGTGSTLYDVGRYLLGGGENPFNPYTELAFLGVEEAVQGITNIYYGVTNLATRNLTPALVDSCAELGGNNFVTALKNRPHVLEMYFSTGHDSNRRNACYYLIKEHGRTDLHTTEAEILSNCCSMVAFENYCEFEDCD